MTAAEELKKELDAKINVFIKNKVSREKLTIKLGYEEYMLLDQYFREWFTWNELQMQYADIKIERVKEKNYMEVLHG